MKVVGTEYNLNHKALEVYLSGCKAPHCQGCHNEELWDFNVGYDAFGSINGSIIKKITNPMVKRVWIMGGEPLDQNPKQLLLFMATLEHFSGDRELEYWIWTRYTELPEKLWWKFTHAKIGPYMKNLPSYIDEGYGITLASSNQRIIKLDKQI